MSFHKHISFSHNNSNYTARAIRPEDESMIRKGFGELSTISKYYRFFVAREKLGESDLKFINDINQDNNVAWGIAENVGSELRPVGLGRFVKLQNEPHTAEIAITVIDSYQRQGIGSILYGILSIIGAQANVKTFRCYIISDNSYVLKKMQKLGIIKKVREGNVFVIEAEIFPKEKIKEALPVLESL